MQGPSHAGGRETRRPDVEPRIPTLMHAPDRLSRRGFTLVEVLVVLVVVGICAAAGYVLQFRPSEATAGVVAMQRNLETFSVLETREFREKGRYERPELLLQRGAMALSDRVEVDSVGYAADRVYLRLRHRDTEERCSVDLSAVSENARNYRQCFGGASPDSLERPVVPDGPPAARPDTAAVARPPAPPSGPVVRAPVVEDPADLVVAPGGTVRQTFRVTNPGAVAREYRFTALSSDAALVPAPAHPTGRVIGAGESVDVPVESSVAAGAAAGRASAVALEAVDAGDQALSGRGRFAVMAGAVLEAPELAGPGPVALEPGGTVAMRWTVRNRSNAARVMDLVPGSGDASLAMVAVVGAGRLRLEPGASRSVEATFRLASPSTAGTTRSASLSVQDVMAPAYRAAAAVPVTTRLVVAAPAVAGPADRTVNPGETFTASWTVANRSNAVRRFTATPALGGPSELVLESASTTDTVTVPEGGEAAVKVTYRLRPDAVAGTRNAASLQVADADAPEFSASSSFTATTALVLAAPAVEAPEDRSAGPGERFAVAWTVRNATNEARVLNVAPGVAAGGELAVVGASGTGAVTFQPFETRTATVTYEVRSEAAGGSASEAQLAVSDRDQPSYAGRNSFRFTTATVLKAPGVSSLGNHTGDPGSAGAARYRLVNRSNVRRTFRLVATSSNSSAVPDPADPVQVTVDPFGSVDLSAPFRVDARAVAGSTAALGLQATDAAAGAWTGSAAATFTTNLAVKAPGVGSGGSVTGYSGEDRSLVFSLTNHSNAARRISFSVTSSNGAVVPSPAVPAPVEVDPYATVYVPVPVRFAATPSSSLASTVTVTAADPGGLYGTGTGGATRINRPPSVTASFSPDHQPPGSPVQLHAAGSDPDGTVRAYTWYLIDPAGGWRYAGAARSQDFTPDRDGTWYGYVVATDDWGAQSAAYTGPITVAHVYGCTDPAARNHQPAATANDGSCVYNRAPVAVLDVTYPEGRSFAWEGETVTLDLRRSWDPDADPLTGNLGSGLIGAASWGAEGTYYVTGVVSDGEATGSEARAVIVKKKVIGCMDPGAANHDQSANAPGTCVYTNAPPVISSFVMRNTAMCSAGPGGGWTYRAEVLATDPDGDPLSYRWVDRDGQPAWTTAPTFTSPCWLRAYPGNGPAFVEVSDGRGGTARVYFGYTPLE